MGRAEWCGITKSLILAGPLTPERCLLELRVEGRQRARATGCEHPNLPVRSCGRHCTSPRGARLRWREGVISRAGRGPSGGVAARPGRPYHVFDPQPSAPGCVGIAYEL